MKEKTKKILKRSLIVIGLLFVTILITVMFLLGYIIDTAVETLTPKVAKVEAKVGSCFVFPFSGYFNMNEFELGNPQGFSTPHAIKFNEITVKINVLSLLSDVIIVEEVLIDGGDITIEQGLTSNNLKTILSNVETFAKQFESDEASQPQETDSSVTQPAGASKKVCIRKVTVSNTTVAFAIKGISSRAPIPLPNIELANIGENVNETGETQSTGVSWPEAIKEILDGIINGAVKGASQAGTAISESASNVAKSIGTSANDAAKSIGASASGATESVGGAASEAVKSTKDAIKGIGDLF